MEAVNFEPSTRTLLVRIRNHGSDAIKQVRVLMHIATRDREPLKDYLQEFQKVDVPAGTEKVCRLKLNNLPIGSTFRWTAELREVYSNP
jgi:hypothetical protein